MKFKHLLSFVGCCAAFGLIACGDDSSSNTSGSMDDRVEHFTVISLDEQTKTLVAFEEKKREYCVFNQATKQASWQTVNRGNDTTVVQYEFITIPNDQLAFIKDSLHISVSGNTAMKIKKVSKYVNYDEEYRGSSTLGIFVGGTSSTVKGTWVSVPCEEYEEGLECYSSGSGWTQMTISISDRSISASETYIRGTEDDEYGYDEDYEYDDDDYYTDDATESGLMYSLYEVLGGFSTYVRTGYSAMEKYSSSIKYLIEELGVTLISKSKNAARFTLDNKTYDVKANVFKLDDEYDARTIDLTVSADGKSCNLSVDAADEISKSTCKADYTGYDYDLRDVYSVNNDVIAVAIDEYAKDNEDEFTACVMELAGKQGPVPVYDGDEDLENGDLDDDWSEWDDDEDYVPDPYVLYKKNADNKKSAAEFWRTYKRNMKKLRAILQEF